MNPERINPNVHSLAERWWLLVVRGVVAIAFGLLALAEPDIAVVTLVIFFGTYALFDGAFNLMLAAKSGADGGRWGWLLFDGLASITAGLVAFVWPEISALALLVVIALWALVTGVGEIVTSIRVRRQVHGEWMLAASGVLSIIFGGALLLFPRSNAVAILWLISAFAISFGALLIGLGYRLHRWHRLGLPRAEPTEPSPPREPHRPIDRQVLAEHR